MQDFKLVFQFTFPFWRKYLKQEFLILLMSGLLLLCQFQIPLRFREVIDSIYNRDSVDSFLFAAIILASIILLQLGISWGYSVFVAWVGESLIIDVTSQVYNFAQQQRRSFWQKFYPNDVLTRLTQDIVSTKSFIIDFTHSVLFQFASLAGTLVILFYLLPRIGYLILAFIPTIFLITYWGNNFLNTRAVKLRQLASSFMQTFQKAIHNISLTFSWNLRPFYMQSYSILANRMKKEQVSFVNQMQIANTSLSVANLLVGTLAVLWILKTEFIISNISTGTLFAIVMFAGRATDSTINVANLIVTGKIDRVAVIRIKEILSYAAKDLADLNSTRDKITHPFFNGSLKEGVKLPDQNNYLFFLSAKNGTGKSTLAHILSGYDDLAGKIISERWFLIPSDPVLFDGSLLDNIRIISGQNISEPEVCTIIKKNGLAALLALFQDGLTTPISDHSEKVSRGQKQAVVLIAAVVKDSPYVVVDEGLNSLDSNLKLSIREPLLAWLEKRRSVVIEHEKYLSATNGNEFELKNTYLQEK